MLINGGLHTDDATVPLCLLLLCMLGELLMRFGCMLWRDGSLNSHPLFSSSHCRCAYRLCREFTWGLFVGRRVEWDLCRASVAANAQIGPFMKRLSLLLQHSCEALHPPNEASRMQRNSMSHPSCMSHPLQQSPELHEWRVSNGGSKIVTSKPLKQLVISSQWLHAIQSKQWPNAIGATWSSITKVLQVKKYTRAYYWGKRQTNHQCCDMPELTTNSQTTAFVDVFGHWSKVKHLVYFLGITTQTDNQSSLNALLSTKIQLSHNRSQGAKMKNNNNIHCQVTTAESKPCILPNTVLLTVIGTHEVQGVEYLLKKRTCVWCKRPNDKQQFKKWHVFLNIL